MPGFVDLTSGDVIFYTTTKDQHELVTVDEKEATIGEIGKVVAGDINSQVIEFEIDRYYDNVDLTTKTIYLLYKTNGGVFKDAAINESYSDDKIRFSWLLNEDATLYSGKIQAVIQIEGKDEKDNLYVMKSLIFEIPVIEALCEFDADGIYHSWAKDIEERIEALEEFANKGVSMFIGTSDEFNAAVAAGKITDGMLITITDA